ERCRQVDCFQFNVSVCLERNGSEIHYRFYARFNDTLQSSLSVFRGHGKYRNFDFISFDRLRKAFYVENRNAADFFSDLLRIGIEKSGNGKICLLKSVVVRESRSEPSCADYANAMFLVEAENFCQVICQARDVIANTPNPKFAKVCQVFPDLRRIKMETFCQCVGRNGLLARGSKLIKTAKIDAETISGQFR